MSLAPLAWGLPWSLCLMAGAVWAWPRPLTARAVALLICALAWAWAPSAGIAVACAGAVGILSWRATHALASEALALPLLVGTLLRLRMAWWPVLPEKMAFWSGLAALVLACLAGQGVMAAESNRHRSQALLAGQAAWALFGLVTGSPLAPLAWTGMLSLAWQQPLLRQPLSLSLQEDAPAPWRIALLFLGLGGCLGLSAFSAYFQLFVPLMGQGEGVGSMQAKLFSGAGLLAAVAMLAVLVQTLAFGYFYWLQVLPQGSTEEARGNRMTWRAALIWAALGLSLVWGFHAATVSEFALRALQAVDVKGLLARPGR